MGKGIGFIGCGNMGNALLCGLLDKLPSDSWNFCCTAKNPARLQPLEGQGVKVLKTAAEVAKAADLIVLAVKPGHIPEVLDAIHPVMTSDKTLLSIAAGFSIARLRQLLGQSCALVRCMPTTTARVGKGVFAFCFDPVNPGSAGLPWLVELFENLGMCTTLSETQFPAFSALAGAGPAYVDAFLQGLEQAGVTLGFSRDMTRRILVQLAEGCAELASQSKRSFGDLRDEVCSPGGLTIQGINVLERAGLGGLLVDAVRAAERRARELEE